MVTVELKAFIDESGMHDGRLTTMAGWLGRADRWLEFEQKWRSILIRDGLPYIHAIDLKQGRKAFKDKTKWPFPRRLAFAQELGKLTEDHALCSLSVLLNKADYDAAYIAGEKDLRKRRSVIDSKYGVCAKNQGAAQTIVDDMHDVAPERARFINPTIGYVPKDQCPGVQAADCSVYPVYVQERDGIAEVSDLEPGFPEGLPLPQVTHFRAPIRPQTLRDLREGQIAMGGLRRRLGRYWSQLDGFPKGWTVQPLEIGGFLLMPPRPQQPQPEAASLPETDAPVGFVRLECE